MDEKSRCHSPETLIWSGVDYKKRPVSMYTYERDHILDGHSVPMADNFTAIYDTIVAPDSVYESGEFDNREVFFKKTAKATYYPNLLTKVIVEYNTPTGSDGYVVTAFPAKKEGGNVGVRVYPESEL